MVPGFISETDSALTVDNVKSYDFLPSCRLLEKEINNVYEVMY